MAMTSPAITGYVINLSGHAAGAVIFGLFLGLLLRDRSPGRGKAVLAALIACLWNTAELASLTLGPFGPWLEAFQSTALSVLPALLFDLVMAGSPAWAVRSGYLLSAGAAALHLAELRSDSQGLHGSGLYVIAAGFCLLALYAALRRRQRAIPALALLLLALSSLHFAADERHAAWWVEIVVHHAGIPLAMYVLLLDYRFVFLDALIRFLANILVALVFAAAAQTWMFKWPQTALPGITGLLILYAFSRNRVQSILTRLVFRRTGLDEVLDSIRPAGDESALLETVERNLQTYFSSGRSTWPADPATEDAALLGNGAEAVLPVRLSSGTVRFLQFGRRAGGRRYLSEDLEALRLAGVKLRESLEAIRAAEMQRLVAQAELRALQAQIHPHFLFNAFNTLYGVIPKEAAAARQMVLNLADVFRYVLETNQTFVSLEDELKIIRAYLEIEALRLGAKLQSEIDVDSTLLEARIPLLSIEPLIENAVKHGVSGKAAGGTVKLVVRREKQSAIVEVSDTGAGFAPSEQKLGGVGLDNVRRRLRLCYGLDSTLEIASSPAGTTVRFAVPFPL